MTVIKFVPHSEFMTVAEPAVKQCNKKKLPSVILMESSTEESPLERETC